MRRRTVRHCAECGASVTVAKRDTYKRHHYCSTGCQANGWRRSYGIPPVPQWTGSPVEPGPAEVMSREPQLR